MRVYKLCDVPNFMNKLLLAIWATFFSTYAEAQSLWKPMVYDEINLEQKSIILNENFNDNTHNWWLKDYGTQTGKIEDGNYYLNSVGKTKSVYKSFKIYKHMDFEIEMVVKFASQNIRKNGAFGIVWGRHYYDKNQFSFGYTLAQKVNITKRSSASNFKFYIKNRLNDNIDIHGFNKLTIRRVEGDFYFFINEKLIGKFKADPFFGDGIGFAVSNAMLVVDSFNVNELSQRSDFKYLVSTKQEEPLAQTINNPTRLPTKEEEIVLKEKQTKIIADIDINIPNLGSIDDNAFALIIGNENYLKEISVLYAVNDASTFKKYAHQVLGVPSKHIHFITNATYGQMLGEIDWITNVIKAYQGQAKVYFYYAGHGMPDEATKSAYLLPVDGYSGNVRTSIKLADIYTGLSKYQSKSVAVFLDACFSGSSRTGMLTTGRGVKIKPKKEIVGGNMIVLSASSGVETAHPYTEKSHGLFTYFLLKKLQESNGNTNWLELSNYITQHVTKISVVNSKQQTPSIIIGDDLQNTWKEMPIR